MNYHIVLPIMYCIFKDFWSLKIRLLKKDAIGSLKKKSNDFSYFVIKGCEGIVEQFNRSKKYNTVFGCT